MAKVIIEFLSASNSSEARQILEQYPELLSEEADLLLSAFSKDTQDEVIIDLIQSRRNLLALCREVGISQVFEEILNSSNETSEEDLQTVLGILEEVLSLSRSQDMPKKIQMLQHAFSLVRRQSNPEIWGVLHMELGSSLLRNSLGKRSDDIEQAIEHLNQALEVFTYTDFPEPWAEIQNNLAATYSHRILGDKSDNVEQIINHCKEALKVHTPQKFQLQWATAQYILADAYRKRIIGDKGENIETAIKNYENALKVKTQEDFPFDWAMIQNNLALAYNDHVRGDRTENIENIINHYDYALEVFTLQKFPNQWAEIHNNLATAYSDRVRGDRAENIEQSIKHYNYALTVYTLKDFPFDWAMIQNNLANAYRVRTIGDRADNIEKAIEHCNQALEVYTLQDFPVEWAIAQNSLAIAYWDRIMGDRAENIEQAIDHYKKSFDVRTQKDFPVDWAMTQNNLAVAYCERIRGDRAENIEQSIKHCNQALEVRTQIDFPIKWAETQINLAASYWKRIRGSRADNIEQAINHYNSTLEVFTLQNFPEKWATTQTNMATAYWSRIRGDKADNIERAINHCNSALEVFTLQNFPFQWAGTYLSLANAYSDRIWGDRAENIEKAIEHCNQALKIYTRKVFPVEWAMTQNNLATAYRDRVRGDRAENIEQTISHFHNVLQIYRLGSMPNDFRNTCSLLGDLYLDMGRWLDAVESYKNAIKAGDLLYRSGLSAESKTVEVRKNAYIYRNASLAACRLGLAKDALFLLEGGKTRLLKEALRLQMKQPESVPKEEWKKYEQAAEKYRSSTIADSKDGYAQREKKVQKALEELDSAIKIIQGYNPRFQKELDISDILLMLDEETSLLTFCITDKGSTGFVVSVSSGVQLVDIPSFKTDDLNSLLFHLDEQGLITDGWIGNYINYLNALGTNHYKDAFKAWLETLSDVLSSIGNRLLDPVMAKLPSQTKRLIFLPSSGLSLLPLHAVPLSNGQLLCQRYCISYSPSIPLLMEMHNKAGIVQGKGLYAVINPEEDPALVFSIYEGQAISKLFQSSKVDTGVIGTKATVLDRISGRAYLHFSCHGSYDWNDPPQSGLYLVGGKILSLSDLQNDVVNMSSARLVTLSACETGITDVIKGSADEYVGLPAGFMLAGIPCVVSSLWSVPDISTALLMEKFYSNHIVKGMDIPMALQDAQLWVRDLTSSQVKDYVEKCYLSGKWVGESKKFIEQYRDHYLKMAEESPGKKPFQHPYYWAAFTVNGVSN